MNKLFGENLSNIRKQNGMSQSFVAEKLGVTSATISAWENNVCEPSLTTICMLSILYDSSINELIDETTIKDNIESANQLKKIQENQANKRINAKLDGSAIFARIKELCDNQGITLKELSEKSGISQVHISRIKTASDLKLSTIEKIANSCGLTLRDFFNTDLFD